MAACVVCGGEFETSATGRPRETCSDVCRKQRSRKSKRSKARPAEFRDSRRPPVQAPSTEMSTPSSGFVQTYGGRRTRLEPPTAAQLAHARRVDEILAGIFARGTVVALPPARATMRRAA